MKHIATNSYDEVLTLSDTKNVIPKPDLNNEQEIWRQFKAGSELALVHIYNQFYTSLYNYASQFTKDRNLIKDTIHDLFIELIQKREKLSNTTSIKYYLFRSVKNNLIAKLKRNSKINFQADLLNGYDFSLSYSVEQVMVSAQINKENADKINQTLKELSRKQREIIYYYFFEGLTLKEIMGLMNFTNPKSAQNLLYKSIKVIRSKLLITSAMISLILFFKI